MIMKDDLINQISLIENVQTPEGLHAKIMRKLLFLRLRVPLIALFSIFLVNLLISGWRIGTKLFDTELLSAMRALFEGFEWNLDFLSSFIQTLTDYVSIHHFIIFPINLAAVIYLIYLYLQWQKSGYNQVLLKGRR